MSKPKKSVAAKPAKPNVENEPAPGDAEPLGGAATDTLVLEPPTAVLEVPAPEVPAAGKSEARHKNRGRRPGKDPSAQAAAAPAASGPAGAQPATTVNIAKL